jgi:cysteinyl-tRNA synthetase
MWIHGAFLNVRGTKMSKRYGNFLTARDLKDGRVDPTAIRLLTFQTHYRKELDYNDEALTAARDNSRRLGAFRDRLFERATGAEDDPSFAALAAETEPRFREALDDDLNAPRAIAAINDFVTEGNRLLDGGARPGPTSRAVWDLMDGILDVCPAAQAVDQELARWVEERLATRKAARQARNFAEADRIRDELRARGVEMEDTPQGTKWRQI